MKLIVLLICFLSINVNIEAGVYPINAGVKSFALGNSVISSTEHWALFGNPALLTTSDCTSFGFYNQSKFGVSELNTTGFSGSFRTNEGHFGLAFSHYGITEFNRQVLNIGVGRSFQKFRFGACGSYVITKMKGVESLKAVMLHTGIAYDFSDNFQLSISGFNINRAKILDNPIERLESNYALGIKLHLSDEVRLYAEVQSELDLDKNTGVFGLEYQLNDKLSVLLGMATDDQVFSLGGLYKRNRWEGGLSFSYHQYLGVSPALSISYNLKK